MSSLHYITPLVLSDTFNEWFLRCNSLIDVVNNINVYNVDNGWGLSRYRAVDGTTTLRINLGVNEFNNSNSAVPVTAYTRGLRFIDDSGATSATNPDVSVTRKMLALDYVHLPLPTGGVSGAYINEADIISFADSSSSTGAIMGVSASHMLPYGISGDHRFDGNIFFDGDTTRINSSELYIDDVNLYLATSNTGDGSGGYLNDINLEGAGIIIKGASGDKEWKHDYYQVSGGLKFNSWKSNIDLQLSANTKFLTANNKFDIFALVDEDVDLTIRQINNESKYWKIRKTTESSDPQGRLIFFHENTIAGVSADALSLSKKGTVKIGHLDGHILSSGTTHESSFHYTPAQYAIPTTGTTGDISLHYKWTNRKLIHQAEHGFSAGDLLRFSPNGNTYAKANNSNKVSAEVIAIVETTPTLTFNDGGVTSGADQFVAVYDGIVDLSGMTGAFGFGPLNGTGFTSGEVYFLDSAAGGATLGGFTGTEPTTEDKIRKAVLIAINSTEALFVNYLGTVIPSTGGIAVAGLSDLEYNTSTGYITKPEALPGMDFRNKIINGDFNYWQRAEDGQMGNSGADGASGGHYPHGAVDWTGATGTMFQFSGTTGYCADMWSVNAQIPSWGGNASVCRVKKMGFTAGELDFAHSPEPYQSLRFEKNNAAGGTAWLINRVEDSLTFSHKSGRGYVTASYYLKGTSGPMVDNINVSLWQVVDGAVEGITNNGGATQCWAWLEGATLESGFTLGANSQAIPSTSWKKYTHTWQVAAVDTIKTHFGATAPAVTNEWYKRHWMELRIALPGSWHTSPSGSTAWGDTAGIDLARVQLEAGATATDWEHKPTPIEDLLVNRYYQRVFSNGVGYAGAIGTTGSDLHPHKSVPWPYTGRSPINYQLSSTRGECVLSVDILSNDWGTGNLPIKCAAAQNNDIYMWPDSMRVDRELTAVGNYQWKTVYHIDTSIR